MKNRNEYNDRVVEVMDTERAFCQMAEEKGIREAFLAFAAKEAVINRNGKIYAGKKGIEEYFDNHSAEGVTLTWKPDYVDVSESGDMAWTYGSYRYAKGKETSEGIFHTVWKKQNDGSWKYVWD